MNKNWKLYYGAMDESYDEAMHHLLSDKQVFKVNLPCDVHMPLIEHGIIKEPIEGTYSEDCQWIEDKAWWFYKEFEITQKEIDTYVKMILSLDRLDIDGQIYVNGHFLGIHRSFHYPFMKDIKELLNVGKNTITVRLTTGYENIDEERVKPLADKIIQCGNRGDKRRAFSRKPQYASGWDWTERVMTCGMNGDARLIMEKGVSIKEMNITTKEINEIITIDKQSRYNAHLKLKMNLDNHAFVATKDVMLYISIYDQGEKVYEAKQENLLRAGNNYIEIDINLEDIKLWWPNGYGEQALYQLQVCAENEEHKSVEEINFGIRTIKLNQDRLDEENRRFAFEVNDVLIFAKGSNWVPSDAIYARVSADKYETLIQEAALQNNNMLRIWGGGIYEPDIFYDLCDQYGILIWQDFMYACSVYPEYEAWFLEESRNEADYQTKRLRNHPCLALWCGNNEMHWIFGEEADYKLTPAEMKRLLHHIYNYILPEIVNKNVEEGIYWNSSPYGGPEASSELMGDNHIWPSHRYEKPILEDYKTYDERETKFMSEYGYIGPCKLETVEKYCDMTDIDYEKDEYRYHSHYFDSTYEKGMVAKAIKKHYNTKKKLSLDNYLKLGGMAQGKILEYSLEAYRSRPTCSGALLWMYNDAWGEEGWTTIDYYLNRKISYHYVRRALEPIKLIMKVHKNQIQIIGINETDTLKEFTAEVGFVNYDGKKETEQISIKLDKRTRVIVHTMPYQKRVDEGVYFIQPVPQAEVDKSILIDFYQHEATHLTKGLSFEIERDNILKVTSKSYAHGVHFNLPAHIRLSDEYFDLLPGETREVKIHKATREMIERLQINQYNPEKV